MGQSIGDEILFETDPEAEDRNDNQDATSQSFLPRPRSTSAFTVLCDSERACLLQLSVQEFFDMQDVSKMKARGVNGGGESSFKRDFNIMSEMLKVNFEGKYRWRQEQLL